MKTLEFIDRDLGSDLSLSALAGQVKLSPCYFAHLFKRQVATSVEAYVRGRRIHKAQQLLQESSLSIKELVVLVGFSTPEYFSRVFARRLGQSPTAFRMRTRNTEPNR
ncbi:MAG: helix-turn-helix transcriptional regulator [Acidobacteria bacterium]|nr:helix-turn-helix transcriptional regulator [Acidobacteriota bacterium]